MVQLLFMHPLIVCWTITKPSNKVLSSPATCPVLHQRFNLEVRFPFNFHWRWRFFRGSPRLVGLQLRDMENIVHPLEASTQFQLISSWANSPKDLEGTHETLTQFALTGKVKVPGTQQDHFPNIMHLLPVMCIIKALLVALGSPHVLLGSLHKFGNISDKGSSILLAAFNPNNNIKW